ncbi:MAG: hypothetical protein ACR9NN_12670 [Nostochopsis sp.]
MDIIFKLIENLIKLIQHAEETNRRLYQDFAAPSFSDFEKVHQNYIETFLVYRKMIISRDKPLDLNHPVFDKIKEDMLFYGQIRDKLYALDIHEEDFVFGSFIRSIFWYMSYGQGKICHLLEDEEIYPPNAPISYVIRGLKSIFGSEESDEMKRREAASLIDEAVSRLQVQYGDVITEHEQLKKRLLDNRLGNQ